QIVCAFNSNFNITERDPDYGVRQIWVTYRLRQLEGRMGRAVGFVCEPDAAQICVTNPDGDTWAYVVGDQPPIHFCPPFRTTFDLLDRQGTLIHEYCHLVPGMTDAGGYALMGAQLLACSAGSKFTSASDVLANTPDALPGFVMNIGQVGASDVW